MGFSYNRSSTKEYTSRPPKNCRAARRAWDALAEDGEVGALGLLDGLWLARRPNGELDYVDAGTMTDRATLQRAIDRRFAQGRPGSG